jgi:uncharacterized membrane protein
MVVPHIEITAYIFFLALVGGYHLYLRWRLRHDKAFTIQSVNRAAREAWVENIMSDKSIGILGVQTLRNSTMAATFLASTAILLIMGVLNLMQKGGSEDSMLHSLQSGLLASGNIEEIKLLILLVTFFWAFFSFSMAVRMYNHVGYLINSTNSKLEFCPTPNYVSRMLNRSGKYYSYGMRAYYLSVPMVFGMFSPYYLIAASIVLIIVLYNVDRAPDTRASDSDIRRRKRVSDVGFRFKPVKTQGVHAPEITQDEAVMQSQESGYTSKTNIGHNA